MVISKPFNRPEAANAGLDAVKGEYFSFLDEDNFIHIHHFSSLYNALKNTRALVVYGVIKVIGHVGNLIKFLNEDFSLEKLLWENFIPIHALLLKSTLIGQNCRFDETLDVY